MTTQTDLQSLLQVIAKVDEVRAQKREPTPEQRRAHMEERVQAVYAEQGISVDQATIDQALDEAGYALVPAKPITLEKPVRPVMPPSREEGFAKADKIAADCPEGGGFSLVEILLVVIWAMAIAAFVLFPRVQSANQANHMTMEISEMRAGIEQLYAATTQKPRYAGLNMKILVDARVVMPGGSRSYDWNGASLTSEFGGVITARPQNNGYALTYTSVPSSSCSRIAAVEIKEFDLTINGRRIPQNGSLSDAVGACQLSDAAVMEFSRE